MGGSVAQSFSPAHQGKTIQVRGRSPSVRTLADIADKFSRNEILAPNEIRGFLGLPPSKDPKADQLNNSNMPPTSSTDGNQPKDEETPKDEESS